MSAQSKNPDEDGGAEPAGWLTTDPIEDQANFLIDYHQSLWELQKDTHWLLGLYMAKQWLRYLKEPQLDIEELRLFVQALESQSRSQGSAWADLRSRVTNWVAKVEQRQHQ
jgi:hypothetical protein